MKSRVTFTIPFLRMMGPLSQWKFLIRISCYLLWNARHPLPYPPAMLKKNMVRGVDNSTMSERIVNPH